MSDGSLPLPWYNQGLRFACTQCGNCCSGAPGYVWVSPEECERIAAQLNLPIDQFLRQRTRRLGNGRRSLLEKKGGDCEFLVRAPDGKTLCSIHAVRPVQCRTWPFWKSNLSSAEEWAETAKGCPGMNTGPLYDLPAIEAAVKENGTLRL